MKNLILLFSALCLIFSSCTEPADAYKGFVLNGTFTNPQPGTKIYLDNLIGNKINVIDTASVADDGTFVLKGEIDENSIGRIRYGLANMMIILENGARYQFNANQSVPTDYEIEGHSASKTWKNLVGGLRTRQIGPDYISSFVDTVKNPLLGYLAINQIKIEDNLPIFQKYLKRMKSEMPSSSFTADLEGKVNMTASQPRIGVGNMAPDIVLKDPEGKDRSLSDLKGQVVLLDFWASWCKPCRRENPNVVIAYNKYQKEGFTVMSVSLDSNRDKWMEAIKNDNLKWDHHISDLKGWKSSAAAQYNVKSIPTTFLLDKDGKIIAKNLRGAQLEKKLEEIFGA